MAEPTVYKLYLQPGMKLVLFLVPAALIGGGTAVIVWSLWFHAAKAPWPIGLIWLAVAVAYLFYFLSLPHRITLSEDGTVEFVGLLRRLSVRADEIQSIRPQGAKFGFFTVRTARGNIKILAQFDGFHDFLTRLEALHPGVELRGC